MTSLHAARVAAELRRRLGAGTEVEMADGRYGEFKVLVDGQEVLSGGRLAFLGVLPTVRTVVEAVEAHQTGGGTAPENRTTSTSTDSG